MVKGLKAISDVLEFLCKLIGGLAVFAFVCVISLQVILRNIFHMPLIWANDVSVILFVWAVFFGAAVAVRYRQHFVMDIIPPRFEKANCILDIVGVLSGYVFFAFLIYYGYDYTVMGLRRLSPSLNIPQAYFFACIPLSGLFMMWFNTSVFISDIRRLRTIFRKEKGGEVTT